MGATIPKPRPNPNAQNRPNFIKKENITQVINEVVGRRCGPPLAVSQQRDAEAVLRDHRHAGRRARDGRPLSRAQPAL